MFILFYLLIPYRIPVQEGLSANNHLAGQTYGLTDAAGVAPNKRFAVPSFAKVPE